MSDSVRPPCESAVFVEIILHSIADFAQWEIGGLPASSRPFFQVGFDGPEVERVDLRVLRAATWQAADLPD